MINYVDRIRTTEKIDTELLYQSNREINYILEECT